MAYRVGHVKIHTMKEAGELCELRMKNVLYVQGLSNRLIYTGQLRQAGGRFIDITVPSL